MQTLPLTFDAQCVVEVQLEGQQTEIVAVRQRGAQRTRSLGPDIIIKQLQIKYFYIRSTQAKQLSLEIEVHK